MKRRFLILVALAVTTLVCVNIAPAHLLWNSGAPSPISAKSVQTAPSAKPSAAIVTPVGVGLSEPVSLLVLGTLLFSLAEARRRYKSTQRGASLEK